MTMKTILPIKDWKHDTITFPTYPDTLAWVSKWEYLFSGPVCIRNTPRTWIHFTKAYELILEIVYTVHSQFVFWCSKQMAFVHMPRQLSWHGMCKIGIWSDHYFHTRATGFCFSKFEICVLKPLAKYVLDYAMWARNYLERNACESTAPSLSSRILVGY